MTPPHDRLITGLDHLVLRAADVDAAARDYALLLGREPVWGAGADGAQAARFDLGNMSLLIQAGAPQGLAGLCFRIADAERMARRLDRLGMPAERTETGEGVILTLAPSATRSLPLGMATQGAARAGVPGAAGAVTGLDHVVVNTRDGEATAALFGARLGLDLRAVVDNPAWGARLYFFRCGDLIVELAERRDAESAPGVDRFYGLSWRVGDAEAVRARLAEAGVDVSELRRGRKPGTRVFTIRDRTAGVPTLVIEQPRRPPA